MVKITTFVTFFLNHFFLKIHICFLISCHLLGKYEVSTVG